MGAEKSIWNPMNWFSSEEPKEEVKPKMTAERVGSGTYRTIGSVSFNGEKNFGEIGPVKDYVLDYGTLRQRSWDLFLDSEIAQTVLRKYVTWVIGKGLKLQSEPIKRILNSEGVSIDAAEFSAEVEARFTAYAKSKKADHSGMRNLNALASDAFKNAMVGGDVLVILRLVEGVVTVQLIDGVHVVSPQLGSESFPFEHGNNKIVNGVELAPNGEHIAYHVRKPGLSFDTERIPARGKKSGVLMAYLVYGNRYRLDNHRGIPLLAVLFETAKKLERYKEATVGSAEERAKIVYSIEHKEFSTGEDPLVAQTARAFNYSESNDDLPTDDYGNALASKVAASTNKQVFNMPVGSMMKALESKNELYFKDFYEMNIVLFCAAAEIPFEVALSKYDSNFSASRAALKDWENSLNVQRAKFGMEFYQPIYEFFLEVEIMKDKIKAPGYIQARLDKNYILLEAIYNARFAGAPVPHIDPLKEVQAERAKIGDSGKSIPLTTIEQATEALGGGDSGSNLEQYGEELKKSKGLGIKAEPKETISNNPDPKTKSDSKTKTKAKPKP
jgi:capsid protein